MIATTIRKGFKVETQTPMAAALDEKSLELLGILRAMDDETFAALEECCEKEKEREQARLVG